SVVGGGAQLIGLSGPMGATVTGPYGGRATALVTGGMTLSGGAQTHTSAVLSPPAAPEYVSPWRGAVGPIVVMEIIVLFGVGIVAAILQLLFGAVGSVLGSLVWSGSLIGYPIYAVRSRSAAVKARRNAYEWAMPRWRKAMERWAQLFYCHRCDGVFVPGAPSLVPAGHIMD